LFASHWAWAVISAYTVGVAARSRGDALLKGVRRTLGAAGGTLTATVLARAVGDHRSVTVVLLLAVLAAGFYLRQSAYAWWAAAISAALTLLYSLLGLAGTQALALLGDRLLAVAAGALCAILPAMFLAPIRTGAVLRKRTAEALRAVRAALSASASPDRPPRPPGQAAADDFALAERRIVALREAAQPLLVIRRCHERPELAWVDALTGLRPDLRILASAPEDRGTRERVGRTLAEVADSLRSAVAADRATGATPAAEAGGAA